MNEKLKELAVQAGLEELDDGDWSSLDWTDVYPEDLERFAELVRQEERKACAKLCDDWLVGRDDICEVAKAIRTRGEQ